MLAQFFQFWWLLVCHGPIANHLMASWLHFGNQNVHWSGMSLVLTHLQSNLYEVQAASEGWAVAALAEQKKKTKYEAIAQAHLFYMYLIAIETSGVVGPDAYMYAILCDLACWIKATSNEPNLKFQQISVAVQRGIVASCWFRFRCSVLRYVYMYVNCVCKSLFF